jgi:hypothetical protein
MMPIASCTRASWAACSLNAVAFISPCIATVLR